MILENKTSLNKLLILVLSISTIILSLILIPMLVTVFQNIFELVGPFILSFTFAFLLNKTVTKLENFGFSRSLSVILLFVVALLLGIFIIMNIVPTVKKEVIELSDIITNSQDVFEKYIENINTLLQKYNINFKLSNDYITNLVTKSVDILSKIASQIFSVIVNSIFQLSLIPMITFYFLLDYNKIVNKSKKILEKNNLSIIHQFLSDANHQVGQYFRGLIIIMNVLSVCAFITLWIFGIEYPLLFGFIIGYTNVIPIVGPFFGGIPVFIFALTTSWTKALTVVILIVALQLLDQTLITPFIQSKSTNVHPLLILLSLVIFSSLLGIYGFIFAIPILLIILLLIKYIHMHFEILRHKKGCS